MPKRSAAAIADGGKPRGGGEQRGHKEKGFAYLRSNEPGSDPSSVTRCAVCPTPSLRFASRVQRESKCKRPKQTFKASWVGVKGEGMVKLLGEKADTLEKPSQLGVLVPDVSKALLPKYPFQDLTSGLGAVGTPSPRPLHSPLSGLHPLLCLALVCWTLDPSAHSGQRAPHYEICGAACFSMGSGLEHESSKTWKLELWL